MTHQQHLEYTARPKDVAEVFRCSGMDCGKMLLASLTARLNHTSCLAEDALRCHDHKDQIPLAWTRSRSVCMELLDRWHADGDLNAYLTRYAQGGRKSAITYPGTTLDGLRDALHWGRHWGIYPQSAGVRS